MIDQNSTIDWELCLTLCDNDKDIASDLLKMLIQTLPADFQEISTLYQQKNYEQLALKVHRLHGALCYTGVPYLKAATKDFEQLLRDKNYTHLDSAYDIFSEELANVLRDYEKLQIS